MRKLLFNSTVVAGLLLAAACEPHRVSETGSDPDSLSATNDTLTPADRTYVDIDTIGLRADSGSNDSPAGNGGGAKIPGQAPKPGTTSKVDSIKNSYPKKK
ncbi:MAG TPA: hypothetical protein VEY71_12185 [Chitinophagales bacterium]|nr:hypothetical protein [Chitinophagales bacterium]